MNDGSARNGVFPITVGLLCVLLLSGWLLSRVSTSSAAEQTEPKPRQRAVLPDPSRVEGQKKCIDCHKSELRAWMKSTHGKDSFEMLRVGDSAKKAKEIAEKLEITEKEITQDALCMNCHSTRQLVRGKVRPLGAVSCESCHNASGGEQGWLNVHAVYGPIGTRRENESRGHHTFRVNACRQAGQSRIEESYNLVKSCFKCHVVGNEELVNKAEHPPGTSGFEFVQYSQGEVRHNFHLDQSTNAEASSLWMKPQFAPKRTATQRKRLLFVLGQLANLETNLRNRANATKAGQFVTVAETQIAAANGQLTALNAQINHPKLKEAIDAVTGVFGLLFSPPTAEQKPKFESAADTVAASARAFVKDHDAEKVAPVDEYLKAEPIGKPYQPK